jgi:hypothetical protein
VAVPLLATAGFVTVLVLAVANAATGSLVVVGVTMVVGAIIMYSMKPPAEGEGTS